MKYLKYLIVIITICITACSCINNDGLYTFEYIEYKVDDKVQTTDCNDLESLPIGVRTICECKNLKIELKDNYYTLSMTEGHLEDGYFYIDGEDIYFSDTEDGEYKHTGWLHYKNGKIYYGINETYVVLKK